MADEGKRRKRRKFHSESERKSEKRKLHAEAEKRRKDHVSEQIRRLNDLLPFNCPPDVTCGRVFVLEKICDLVKNLVQEKETLKEKCERLSENDEEDMEALRKNVEEKENEKLHLGTLLDQKKRQRVEKGVQCCLREPEDSRISQPEVEKSARPPPPPSFPPLPSIFSEIDNSFDLTSSLNWDHPVASAPSAHAPATISQTIPQSFPSNTGIPQPHLYQPCQYQDCEQQRRPYEDPSQQQATQQPHYDSFSVQALTASREIQYHQPSSYRHQGSMYYSPTKYITPHKEFDSQFSIRALQESSLQRQHVASQSFSIETLTRGRSMEPRRYDNGFNISSMINDRRAERSLHEDFGGVPEGQYRIPEQSFHDARYMPL